MNIAQKIVADSFIKSINDGTVVISGLSVDFSDGDDNESVYIITIAPNADNMQSEDKDRQPHDSELTYLYDGDDTPGTGGSGVKIPDINVGVYKKDIDTEIREHINKIEGSFSDLSDKEKGEVYYRIMALSFNYPSSLTAYRVSATESALGCRKSDLVAWSNDYVEGQALKTESTRVKESAKDTICIEKKNIAIKVLTLLFMGSNRGKPLGKLQASELCYRIYSIRDAFSPEVLEYKVGYAASLLAIDTVTFMQFVNDYDHLKAAFERNVDSYIKMLKYGFTRNNLRLKPDEHFFNYSALSKKTIDILDDAEQKLGKRNGR